MIQPQDKYMMRFPDGMRDKLKQLAADNGRSLNAEIVHRLTSSMIEEAVNLTRTRFVDVDPDSTIGKAWKVAGKYDTLEIPTDSEELKQDLLVLDAAIRHLLTEAQSNNAHHYSLNKIRVEITEALFNKI